MAAYGSGVPAPADHVLLTRAGEAAGRVHRRAAAGHGLTSTSMGVLDELSRRTGGTSHRELAGRLGITPATLTPVVDALADSGALARERDPVDRRVVRLSITPHGRERLAAAAVAVAGAVRARIPAMPPAVREYLLAVLEET
jgi:DNA-binding MarR family transcriptional regulator